MKITVRTSANIVRTSARNRVSPVDAVLPADEFLPSADVVKTASVRPRHIRAGAGPCRHTPASAQTQGKKKKKFKNLKILKKIYIFNFFLYFF
jgi:hypothetical protein